MLITRSSTRRRSGDGRSPVRSGAESRSPPKASWRCEWCEAASSWAANVESATSSVSSSSSPAVWSSTATAEGSTVTAMDISRPRALESASVSAGRRRFSITSRAKSLGAAMIAVSPTIAMGRVRRRNATCLAETSRRPASVRPQTSTSSSGACVTAVSNVLLPPSITPTRGQFPHDHPQGVHDGGPAALNPNEAAVSGTSRCPQNGEPLGVSCAGRSGRRVILGGYGSLGAAHGRFDPRGAPPYRGEVASIDGCCRMPVVAPVGGGIGVRWWPSP